MEYVNMLSPTTYDLMYEVIKPGKTEMAVDHISEDLEEVKDEFRVAAEATDPIQKMNDVDDDCSVNAESKQ